MRRFSDCRQITILRINKKLLFFQAFNGISIFQDQFWTSNADFSLYTDSAGAVGFGIYFQDKWAYSAWPLDWSQRGITSDITVLEWFPILVAVTLWGSELQNKKLLFHCDNQAVVHIINTQSSKSKSVMVVVRELVLRCLQFNLTLKSEHIPGSKNSLADALSRFQIEKFRRLAPRADPHPTAVPGRLFSIFDKAHNSY